MAQPASLAEKRPHSYFWAKAPKNKPMALLQAKALQTRDIFRLWLQEQSFYFNMLKRN
jgi:hypothetical protein